MEKQKKIIPFHTKDVTGFLFIGYTVPEASRLKQNMIRSFYETGGSKNLVKIIGKNWEKKLSFLVQRTISVRI